MVTTPDNSHQYPDDRQLTLRMYGQQGGQSNWSRAFLTDSGQFEHY